jgi:UDP-N-acetylglucosamine--N-acetylmuramyl-(pentapeptide) pyrophosphoryl-undecaprenol N-acetylglucosamine transferase
MAKPMRLMLTGGGTGGHLFPAIATAEALCARLPGSEILFVGTRRKMDSKALKQYGYASCSIHSKGLKGKNILSLLQGLAVLPLSFLEAMYHILRFQPDVVMGVGGYVTGPVVAAARILGKPTLIHEQNSVPGLANRKLGCLVNRVCLSLPGSGKAFPEKKTVLTGNPVRHAILELAQATHAVTKTSKTLVVLGGSLGAHRVNELVWQALALGHPGLHGIRVIHQTGPADVESVRAMYKKNQINATVEAFFDDMAAIYSEADLLVSRAGATTLAELALLGKPAILIPYPYAADNHQVKNAGFYVEGGGAKMFLEKDLSPEILAQELGVLFEDQQQISVMSSAMGKRSFPDAAEQIVAQCMSLLPQKTKL